MERDTSIIDLLKGVGLSQYEANVFLELFKQSPLTASTLVESASVPRGRIYQVLEELNRRGLVIAKPSRGRSNLYELAPHPDGLTRLHGEAISELEQQISSRNTAHDELLELLESYDRKQADSHREEEQMMIVRGGAAKDYYMKKILTEAQNKVVTNFTVDLLKRYAPVYEELKNRGVKFAFYLTEAEIPKVETLLRGSEVNFVPKSRLDTQLLILFSEKRPPMTIVDDKVGIIFIVESDDALLVRNPALLRQMTYLLSLIKQETESKTM